MIQYNMVPTSVECSLQLHTQHTLVKGAKGMEMGCCYHL